MNRPIETNQTPPEIPRAHTIRDIQRIIRKRKLIIISTVIFFILSSSYFIYKKTPIYMATASVELTGMFEDISRSLRYKPYYELKTETMIVTSLRVLSGAAKELGLIDKGRKWDEIRKSSNDLKVLKGLKSRIEARARENAAIIDISARSTSPEEAHSLADAVAHSYMQHREQIINEKDIYLEQFYTKQRDTLQREYDRAKEEETRFKKEHRITDLSITRDINSNEVRALMNELKLTRRKLKDVKQAREELLSPRPSDMPSRSGEGHQYSGIVVSERLNVHTGPGKEYQTIGVLGKEDEVEIIDTNHDWYYVSVSGGMMGWVSSYYIALGIGKTKAPVQKMVKFSDMEQRLNSISKLSYIDKSLAESGNSLLNLLNRRNKLLKSYTYRHPYIKDTNKKIRKSWDLLLDNIKRVEYSLLDERDGIQVEIETAKGEGNQLLDKEIELTRLTSKVNLIEGMITSLDQGYQQRTLINAHRIEKVHLIEPATIPKTPINKTSYHIIFGGAIIGFIIGLGLAFLRESIDFTFNTIHEVEAFFRCNVLGIIPHFEVEELLLRESRRRGRDKTLPWFSDPRAATMIVHFWSKSPISEGFRSLRMSLGIKTNGNPAEIIMLTSASPKEGKSFISSNLAIAFAQSGNRTLLIEMDMRRPSLHKIFNLHKEPGLSDIIRGKTSVEETVRDISDLIVDGFDFASVEHIPGLHNLYLIPGGQTPVHPTELLEGLVGSDFFEEVKRAYDVVILDSPAIVPVADSSVISTIADKILMVYHMGKTPKDLAKRAYDTLHTMGMNITGVILSNVDMRLAMAYPRYYYRYYKYGYGARHTRYYRFPYAPYYRLKKAISGYRFPSYYHNA